MRKGKEFIAEWESFVQTGNEAAYHALYLHYYHYLTYIGAKRGAPISRIKDNINDLFLYIWENRDRLSHTLNHHNYIVTSFLRKLFQKEKFSADQSEVLEDLADLQIVLSVESRHIELASSVETNRLLAAYMQQLPPKQRGVIYQKFFLELSYQEIAEANKVSINTVYNTIYNAIDKLKIMAAKQQPATLFGIISFFMLLFLIFFSN